MIREWVVVDESPIDLTSIVLITIGGAALYRESVCLEPHFFSVYAVCILYFIQKYHKMS